MNLTPRSLQQVALCYTLVINFPKKLEFIMYLQISRIRVNIYGNLKQKKKKKKKKTNVATFPKNRFRYEDIGVRVSNNKDLFVFKT